MATRLQSRRASHSAQAAAHKKTPPLWGGVVIHDVLRKPEQEFFLDQFWTKPILTICAFFADASTLASTP